ncbi:MULTISPECIES: P-loop NTPase [Vibrio]|uniref:ATPase n=1 Tax=Vibrio tasmaniensis 1F-267 TaxID=1191324 RepID=A0ABX3B933_9VIBR|nr:MULTISPECIES: P-loop NTPase [Vibrio]EAQ53212.1 ATPase involved in chromosome partitioning [Vibrio sp. MED222]OEF52896.1 ATPase [Vibrio tasmaniensis 1F-267]
MFDLVNKLNSAEPKKSEKQNRCAMLFQTEICRDFIQKSFRFEGLNEPSSFASQDTNVTRLEQYPDVEVVFVELNQSQDIVADAQLLTHTLPPHVSVIIIGSEDTISIIRALRQLGFYYLFWPAGEAETIDFYHNVSRNHAAQQGVSTNRKAKQIAVMGVKGGVGTSLVACEISRRLAKHQNASTLLVDYTYTGSNIDVMLGLKKFTKRSVQKGTLTTGVDNDIATSLVQNIEKNLSLLAVESDEFGRDELFQYTQSLKKQMISSHAFVVEDYSHTATTNEEFRQAVGKLDALVLVFDATVSSLRELNRIRSEIDVHYPNLVVLTVMNRSRPHNAASISEADVVKYFGREADANLVFDFKANQYLLQGELLSESRSEMKYGLQTLVALLMGEKVAEKTAFSFFQWLKR